VGINYTDRQHRSMVGTIQKYVACDLCDVLHTTDDDTL
jgi:hypothetical protein